MSTPATIEEIDSAITELSVPRGDPGDRATRASALEFLLSQAEAAHPRLMAALDPKAGGSTAVVLALAQFGRPDSVPLLESILRNAPTTSASTAARALAAHPLPAAYQALLRALYSTREETSTAAADGLLLRNDRSACPELMRLQNAPNLEIRSHAMQAAAGLGCADAAGKPR